MIAHITGDVKSIGIDRAIVDVNGIGYLVLITAPTAARMNVGNRVQLFTSMVVREDSMTLYGFLDEESKNLFEAVQTVSGIGPKVALSIVSALGPSDLAQAIASEDIAAIEKVPGIGRKGAQRMILELKGKLSDFGTSRTISSVPSQWREQLSSALISLGFSPKEADSAISFTVNELTVQNLDPAKMDIGDLLKRTLATGRRSL